MWGTIIICMLLATVTIGQVEYGYDCGAELTNRRQHEDHQNNIDRIDRERIMEQEDRRINIDAEIAPMLQQQERVPPPQQERVPPPLPARLYPRIDPSE
ncbi:hypothetical protein TKK_0003003 [Trichogramma kaykai]